MRAAAVASIAIVLLAAVVSVGGLVLGAGGLYGNSGTALGPTPSTAGILVPGFLGHDAFNLVVALPLLLGTVWAARRGNLIGLLLWPGVLYYTFYTYSLYLIAAPFSGLFLVYALLVAVSAFTTIHVLAGMDRAAVQQQLGAAVPARLVGGLLIGLALLTIAQDASGAIGTALAGRALSDPLARPVWAVDLSVEVPAVLLGGWLLWRRRSLGYVAAAGLLLQYGLTPVALGFGLVLQALATGSPVDWGTLFGVLAFAVVCFAPLAVFVRAGRIRSANAKPGSHRVAASTMRPAAPVTTLLMDATGVGDRRLPGCDRSSVP
jgi:hypothetical protein